MESKAIWNYQWPQKAALNPGAPISDRAMESPSSPTRRKRRNLELAVTLRPADVFELYGIPTSTLSCMCRDENPQKRLPSILIPGRRGRRGIRLINHQELRGWLERWRVTG